MVNTEEQKEITLPSTLIDKLQAMAVAYKEQDNRCTAKPYYFTIREMKRVYGMDPEYGFDDSFVWVSTYDSETSYEPDDLPEDFNEDDYEKRYYSLKETHTGVFLTEEEADRHLRVNHYHYNPTAATYVEHAFRNYDMETIVELFDALTKENK